MSETFKCPSGCCSIKINPYVDKKDLDAKIRRARKKAGMFIVDPNSGKILIVQSRGRLWGPPKGTMEQGENDLQCAMREIKEETGLDISVNLYTSFTRIKGRIVYYYVQHTECEVNIQEDVSDNDVNAIGWIHPKCMGDCISAGNISVTHHTRILLRKYFNYQLPHSNFTLVEKR